MKKSYVFLLFSLILLFIVTTPVPMSKCFALDYQTEKQTTKTSKINNEITILRFMPLLAFPDVALSDKNKNAANYNKYHLTPSEFGNVLEKLHKKNYVLININECTERAENHVSLNMTNFPKDKKPLVLCFESLNYEVNKNTGLIDKIILDRYNRLASYNTRQSIMDKVSYENEFFMLLTAFIQKHPDFSHNGAKGLIATNGFDGLLGYKTTHRNASSRHETKRAMEIVLYLKKTGWSFCYNGYYNKPITECDDIEFAKDITLWNKEIKPVIGSTSIALLNKNDNELLAASETNSYKQKLLSGNGFNVFIYVSKIGSKVAASSTFALPSYSVNGENLLNKSLDSIMDSSKILDTNLRNNASTG